MHVHCSTGSTTQPMRQRAGTTPMATISVTSFRFSRTCPQSARARHFVSLAHLTRVILFLLRICHASFWSSCAFGTRHFASLAHLSLLAALQIHLLALGGASRSATKGASNTAIMHSHSLMQSRDVQLQAGCIVGQDYPLPIVDHVSFSSVHTRTPRLLVYRVTPV